MAFSKRISVSCALPIGPKEGTIGFQKLLGKSTSDSEIDDPKSARSVLLSIGHSRSGFRSCIAPSLQS